MYTYTPTSKFLVLLPHTSRAMDMPGAAGKAIVDGAASPPQSPLPQGRSDSFSMETSNTPNEAPPSLLPGGFLKLGLDTK